MGSHPIQRCRSARCGTKVFFAPTTRGKTAILDAAPAGDDRPDVGTFWLDGEGVAHSLKKGEAAPEGKPRYANHWITCLDVPKFADERLAKERTNR